MNTFEVLERESLNQIRNLMGFLFLERGGIQTKPETLSSFRRADLKQI